MRRTAAEVLDWFDKQHVTNANERKRRAALQLVLDAAGEPHSADDLLGILVYRHLGVSSTSSAAHAQRCIARRKRLFQVQILTLPDLAAQVEQENIVLTNGVMLRFPHTHRHGRGKRVFIYFSSVEAAVQGRDEAYFAIYGLCAPCNCCTSTLQRLTGCS